MLVHEVEQGSEEWIACRLGMPTASEFSKVITPTGKSSRQSAGYLNRLLAEKMFGRRVDAFRGSYWTVRGAGLESEAVAFYELHRDINTTKVGFCTDDARTMGASPDRLVGQDGLLEIKCPAPHTHRDYLRHRKLAQKYYPQVQGQLFVTGRQWVDLVSYQPGAPSLIMRIERDAKYLAAMAELLAEFTQSLQLRHDDLSRLDRRLKNVA